MGLNLDAKKAIVDEIANVAAEAPSAIAAEYIGLTVADMTKLRTAARESGVYLKVVRNTLARRAFENSNFECMRDSLVGPLVYAFSSDEPGSAARVIRDFSKENDKLVVKLVALDGQLLDPSELGRLASMPSQDEARAMLLGLLSAPMGKFARTVNEVPSKLARVLAAKRDQAA